MYIFVTGGYRSGRSNYALRRASELGQPPWLYASAEEETEEAVRKRIEGHRRDVEAIWRPAALPVRLVDLFDLPALQGCGAVVIDGVMEWIRQRLAAADDRAVLDEVGGFGERIYRSAVPAVITSTELGMGILPRDEADMRLVRVVSTANQLLAQHATGVVLMVSGAPFKVR